MSIPYAPGYEPPPQDPAQVAATAAYLAAVRRSEQIALASLLRFSICSVPVGSRITCNPAPTDTDEDYLVLVKSLTEFDITARSFGWELGGSQPTDEACPIKPDTEFFSFTFGRFNVIATMSQVFYDRFSAATSVAKRLNLLNKSDRIALFQAVLYARADGLHSEHFYHPQDYHPREAT